MNIRYPIYEGVYRILTNGILKSHGGFMAFSFLLLAFYACTERELHGIRPLDTGISIRTSWGDIVHGDAETLEFHFYPADGSTPIVESAVPVSYTHLTLPTICSV